jgi:hypothetical protein
LVPLAHRVGASTADKAKAARDVTPEMTSCRCCDTVKPTVNHLATVPLLPAVFKEFYFGAGELNIHSLNKLALCPN